MAAIRLRRMPPCKIALGLLLFLLLPLPASSSTPATPPEKAKALRQRFEEGCNLVAQLRLEPALEVFGGILREDPEARGSLLMSGIVLNQLHRFDEAAPFFERFAKLEPNHEQGLIGAVKAFHGAGREAEAEPYRLRLFQLRKSGKSEKLKVLASYEREIIPAADGRWISVQEYFDEADLRPKWAYLQMKDEKTIGRRLQLNLMPENEAKLARAANASFGSGKVYALSEAIYEKGEFKRTKIHRLVSGTTPYPEVKKMALEILGTNQRPE
jgi:tetratricopeptide (TPR) repeat protein